MLSLLPSSQNSAPHLGDNITCKAIYNVRSQEGSNQALGSDPTSSQPALTWLQIQGSYHSGFSWNCIQQWPSSNDLLTYYYTDI